LLLLKMSLFADRRRRAAASQLDDGESRKQFPTWRGSPAVAGFATLG